MILQVLFYAISKKYHQWEKDYNDRQTEVHHTDRVHGQLQEEKGEDVPNVQTSPIYTEQFWENYWADISKRLFAMQEKARKRKTKAFRSKKERASVQKEAQESKLSNKTKRKARRSSQ